MIGDALESTGSRLQFGVGFAHGLAMRSRWLWEGWALACLIGLLPLKGMAAAPLLPAATASQEQPFAWADFTWMNGQSKQRTFILPSSPHVQLSLYLDTYYALSAHSPRDNTLTASASIGRSKRQDQQGRRTPSDFATDLIDGVVCRGRRP